MCVAHRNDDEATAQQQATAQQVEATAEPAPLARGYRTCTLAGGLGHSWLHGWPGYAKAVSAEIRMPGAAEQNLHLAKREVGEIACQLAPPPFRRRSPAGPCVCGLTAARTGPARSHDQTDGTLVPDQRCPISHSLPPQWRELARESPQCQWRWRGRPPIKTRSSPGAYTRKRCLARCGHGLVIDAQQ
jgi:hypothetical protein